LERGLGLEASAGKVALLLTGGWTPVPVIGGSGVLRLLCFFPGRRKQKLDTKSNQME
jgi:hypothetical protein